MTKEQTEYFLSLMSALVETQQLQSQYLDAIAVSLDSLDGQIMDLSYHIRYGGGS